MTDALILKLIFLVVHTQSVGLPLSILSTQSTESTNGPSCILEPCDMDSAPRSLNDKPHKTVEDPIVNMRFGSLEGVRIQADPSAHQPTFQFVDSYLGVPYGVPMGHARHRFRPPVPVSGKWFVRKALSRSESCPQPSPIGGYVGSEDCLNINIWVPEIAYSQTVPVMVYFLDGNQVRGHLAVRKGLKLAASQDVIVVNVMFRLGSLGHWTAETLEVPEGRFAGTKSNWGLLDQTLALRWIQENIGAFGGDRERVTIWGACSGGTDVLYHLVSPFSAGLFSRAILQSFMANEYAFPTLENAYAFFDWFAREKVGVGAAADGTFRGIIRSLTHSMQMMYSISKHLGVFGLDKAEYSEELVRKARICFFSNSIAELNEIASRPGPDGIGRFVPDLMQPSTDWPDRWGAFYPVLAFGPVIDGVSLRATPFELIRRNEFNRANVIVGVTSHETAAMMLSAATFRMGINHVPNSAEDADVVLRHFLGSRLAAERAKRDFPFQPFRSTGRRRWLARVLRDLFFHGPARYLVQLLADRGVSAWQYCFGIRVLPKRVGNLPLLFPRGGRSILAKEVGAFHVSDVSLSLLLFSDDPSVSAPAKDVFSLYMGPRYGGKRRHHWAAELLSTAFGNLAHSGDPTFDRPDGIYQLSALLDRGASWHPGTGLLYISGETSATTSAQFLSFSEVDDAPVEEAETCSGDVARWVGEELQLPWSSEGSVRKTHPSFFRSCRSST